MKNRLARAAYEAYRAHTGGKSLASGSAIPAWDDLRPDIADAWIAAILGIREELCSEIRKEIHDAAYAINERLLA